VKQFVPHALIGLALVALVAGTLPEQACLYLLLGAHLLVPIWSATLARRETRLRTMMLGPGIVTGLPWHRTAARPAVDDWRCPRRHLAHDDDRHLLGARARRVHHLLRDHVLADHAHSRQPLTRAMRRLSALSRTVDSFAERGPLGLDREHRARIGTAVDDRLLRAPRRA
jgi:hypothetical protein